MTNLQSRPSTQKPTTTQRVHPLLLLGLSAALAYAGALWLNVFHDLTGGHEEHELPLPVHALRDGTLALPVVILAVTGALFLARWLLRATPSATARLRFAVTSVLAAGAAAMALAAGNPVHERLFGAHELAELPLPLHMARDALIALAVCLPVAGAVVNFFARSRRLAHRVASTTTANGAAVAPARPPERSHGPVRAFLAGATATSVIALSGLQVATVATPAAAAGSGVCANAARTINYDVNAFGVDLPLNGWGDHVPNGLMYALSNPDAHPNVDEIKAEPGRSTPLVLRAAVGDCIKVHFTNEIAGKRVGMHVDGVAKNVNDSDGAHIGNNPDTTVPTDSSIDYTWFAQREGQFPINDYGSGTDFGVAEPSTDTTSHGLYGGLVVLPAGSFWYDPVTGANLLAEDAPTDYHGLGAPLFVDVRVPGVGNDFRDFAQILVDEPEGICAPATTTVACPPPTFPTTGLSDASFLFNYRTEPLRNRLRAVLDHQAGKKVTLPNGTVILPNDRFCDGFTNDQDAATNAARLAKDKGLSGCLGEESHLQSWAFGDEGKITKATNETDVLRLTGAIAGTYTLTVKDPTLTGPLTDTGSVDQSAPRFPGEENTTAPIAFDASAADVQAALMSLKVLPMADLAPGDVTVTEAAGTLHIAFAQHFAGRDLKVTVDGSQLTADPAATAATATAAVSDATADGGTKGSIEVLSDALIPKAYRGDPVHMRLIHPGVGETHPFHQHTNRWRQEPNDPQSTRLDVQSIGPGQTFDMVYEGGAGEAITADPADEAAGAKSMEEWVRAGRPDLAALAISKSSNGDQIFHCHLYPHFAQGFWGALRVFDRQRPVDPALWPVGTPRTYADATPIEALRVLPDFDFSATDSAGATVTMTQMPDAAHPGYPLMVKGEYLQRAFRAPGAVVADRYGSAALNWRRPGDTVRDYGSAVTTDLERANMVTTTDTSGKKHAVPGAFFINPCPVGVPTREYHPTAIDAKIVYNKAGWNDPDGKMYVEAPPSDPADPSTSIDVGDTIRAKINAGTVQPEPYNIRTRLGECVNMRTTNATNLDNNTAIPLDVHDGQISATGVLTGGNAFHPPTLMSELSTHVHLVRFDQLATDGTSVGWNYVQAPMVGQTYNYKWFADVALRTVYFHDHQNPNTHQQHGLWAAMNVEPSNSTFNNPATGALLVPPYCNGLGLPDAPQAGTSAPACYGVGAVSDIRVPTDPTTGLNGSFREFTVNYSDFVPMYDAAGKAINPPGEPDEYASDQGGMAINYRNEPFPIRVSSESTGAKREPAYVFSSAVHGDPSTPIFRAYQKDPVIFRFMGGAHEEGHNFTLAGHRWLHEPDDPNSNLYDSQFVMISEFFNFEVSGTQVIKGGTKTQAVNKAREASQLDYGSDMILPGGAGAPGDYIYSSQPLNDLWMGMWGIFRVPNKRVADLQPLPSNAAPPTGTAGEEWPGLKPGDAVAPPPTVPKPCATTALQRTYNISMIKTKITYNAAGDNDPNGVMYIENKNLDSAGKPKRGVVLKPLFIRANEGDCLNIVLTNRLPIAGTTVTAGDPVNPVEKIGTAGVSDVTNLVNGIPRTVHPEWPAGNRASIHPSGLIKYYATSSDGSAIGYNWDTTIAPGQTFTYKYYVDTKNIGVANLADYGNLRTNRHHGAWGGLIVEPKGATYLNPKDLTALSSGEEAVIKYPDGTATRSHREFVIDFQDGLNLFDKGGVQIPDLAQPDVPGAAADAEDQGERGVNYRSEPFKNRLARGDTADVFSSTVFGDPATPVFRAYRNDPTYVRVLNSQDLPRVHTFGITGHSWKYEFNDPNTNVVNGQGGLNTSRAFNAGICAGSNTPLVFDGLKPTCASDGIAGDYLYNDRNFFLLPSGVWGLIRVHPNPMTDLKPLP